MSHRDQWHQLELLELWQSLKIDLRYKTWQIIHPMLLPQRNIHLFNAKSITTRQHAKMIPVGLSGNWMRHSLVGYVAGVTCVMLHEGNSDQSWVSLPRTDQNDQKFHFKCVRLDPAQHLSAQLPATWMRDMSILYTADVTGSNPSVSQCKQNFHRWKFWILIQHLLSLWEAQKGRRSQDLRLPSQLLPALPICLHPRGHMTCGWQCCDANHLESQRSQWTGQVEMNATADLSNSWESLNRFWIVIDIHVTPKLSKACCICSYPLFSMPYKSGAHSCQTEITPSMATTTNWPQI